MSYTHSMRRGNLVRAGECLLINEQHIFCSTMRHVRHTIPRVPMRTTCAPVRYFAPTNERVPISHQPFLSSPPTICLTYIATFPFAITLDVLLPICVIVNWNRGIANAFLTWAPRELNWSTIFFFGKFLTEYTTFFYLLFDEIDRFDFRDARVYVCVYEQSQIRCFSPLATRVLIQLCSDIADLTVICLLLSYISRRIIESEFNPAVRGAYAGKSCGKLYRWYL